MSRALLGLTLLAVSQACSADAFTVEVEEDSYAIVEPFQREATIWATLRNTTRGDDVIRFSFVEADGKVSPAGLVHLGAGESVRCEVAHIEHRMQQEGDVLSLQVRMESSGHRESVREKKFTLRFVSTPPEDLATIRLTYRVCDAETKEPIRNAAVYWYVSEDSRTESARARGDGRYEIDMPGADALGRIAKANGLEWPGVTIEIQAEGYETLVEEGLKATESATREMVLSPKEPRVSYTSSWHCPLGTPGVWRVRPSRDWGCVAVAMGKHPDPWDPREPVPTEVHLLGADGKSLWDYAVDDTVWGMDIAPDGSLVVAGTHQGTLYAIGKGGKLLWSRETRTNLREVRFSADGKLVAGETSHHLEVLDARSGKAVASCDPGTHTHWRGVAFTGDGRFAAFAGAGSFVFLDLGSKKPVWHRYIAQVPYDVRISTDLARFTVADKGGNLWCYDREGGLRWHQGGIAVLTDMDTSDDGSRTAALSHDGTIRMFDGDGKLLWRRAIGFGGHNALDMTPDGRFLVAGGGTREAPYAVFVLDADGNRLWRHSQPGPMPDPYHPYMTSAMSVSISDDGARIVAGYGTGSPGIQFYTRDPSAGPK